MAFSVSNTARVAPLPNTASAAPRERASNAERAPAALQTGPARSPPAEPPAEASRQRLSRTPVDVGLVTRPRAAGLQAPAHPPPSLDHPHAPTVTAAFGRPRCSGGNRLAGLGAELATKPFAEPHFPRQAFSCGSPARSLAPCTRPRPPRAGRRPAASATFLNLPQPELGVCPQALALGSRSSRSNPRPGESRRSAPAERAPAAAEAGRSPSTANPAMLARPTRPPRASWCSWDRCEAPSFSTEHHGAVGHVDPT